MSNQEIVIWMLTGIVTLLSILIGAIWKLLRAEAKEHSELIKGKADNDRLHEAEERWKQDLTMVREGNERLISKLENRHDKELEQMGTRLGDQIRTTENNILAQIRLMIQVMQKVVE